MHICVNDIYEIYIYMICVNDTYEMYVYMYV